MEKCGSRAGCPLELLASFAPLRRLPSRRFLRVRCWRWLWSATVCWLVVIFSEWLHCGLAVTPRLAFESGTSGQSGVLDSEIRTDARGRSAKSVGISLGGYGKSLIPLPLSAGASGEEAGSSHMEEAGSSHMKEAGSSHMEVEEAGMKEAADYDVSDFDDRKEVAARKFVNGSSKADSSILGWRWEDLPNPTDDDEAEKCGRHAAGLVCDPDRLLENIVERNEINGMLMRIQALTNGVVACDGGDRSESQDLRLESLRLPDDRGMASAPNAEVVSESRSVRTNNVTVPDAAVILQPPGAVGDLEKSYGNRTTIETDTAVAAVVNGVPSLRPSQKSDGAVSTRRAPVRMGLAVVDRLHPSEFPPVATVLQMLGLDRNSTLEQEALKSYAENLSAKWRLSDPGCRNAVMLVISKKDRRFFFGAEKNALQHIGRISSVHGLTWCMEEEQYFSHGVAASVDLILHHVEAKREFWNSFWIKCAALLIAVAFAACMRFCCCGDEFKLF